MAQQFPAMPDIFYGENAFKDLNQQFPAIPSNSQQ